MAAAGQCVDPLVWVARVTGDFLVLFQPPVQDAGLPAEDKEVGQLRGVPGPGGMADGATVDIEVVPLRHRTLGQEEERLAARFIGRRPEKIGTNVALAECVHRNREVLLIEEHRRPAVDDGCIADEGPYPPLTWLRANSHKVTSIPLPVREVFHA